MSTGPKITIVTPSLNQRAFLMEALESVRQQHCCEVEHIVVDGGSTDGSVELLEQLSATPGWEHLCWTSGPDRGQSDALNKGFQVARGEYIGWLNSDDRYRSGCFDAVLQAFADTPSADIIYGDYTWMNDRGEITRVRREIDYSYFVLAFHRVLPIPSTTTFFRRKIFDEGNLLSIDYRYCMDYDFFLRLARSGYRFQHIPRVLADFRWHAASVSTRYLRQQFREGVEIGMVQAPFVRSLSSRPLRRIALAVLRAAAALRYWSEKFLRGFYFSADPQSLNAEHSVERAAAHD